jgi:hypothetical protein
MGSAVERPDLDALHELEEVLRHLAEELGAWRRRALTAEARLGDQPRGPDGTGGATRQLRELEEENGALAQRLDAARANLSALIGRLAFLEEQAVPEASAKTAKD